LQRPHLVLERLDLLCIQFTQLENVLADKIHVSFELIDSSDHNCF
jgi:hypothetical protein